MSRKQRKSRQPALGTPGWIWMLFGLSIGLVIAAAIYFSDQRAPAVATAPPRPAAPSPTPAREPDRVAETEPAAAEPHPATRFDFYDMLPQFEVVVPESERDLSPRRAGTAIAEAGNYVLQAGAFKTLAEADRMQANLALLGIESRIQRVPIDDDIYHRVRIGPISDLGELNRIRRRLWDADFEVILLRVPN